MVENVNNFYLATFTLQLSGCFMAKLGYYFLEITHIAVRPRPGMLEKKLLVEDKKTASFKEICFLGVICKVSDRKKLSNDPVK